ncbi:outer membrane beta-barrel protein [Mucilaginibacter jinjuensis]|uniref:Outer membrane beta-barrel protein n=1 Tax=Mucilaginibacter jinjuensis TaxID=1176721 RepID=A0ABY7TEY4_9SPHI|nr:outer membrane beta-barrel protein [Mucilaginibacter jinjuensis]WCT14943.1 outer membrane beta-barrel protein [Mucilaginibacter jinjuensis]
MNVKQIIWVMVLIVCTVNAVGQTPDYSKPKKSNFAVYAGLGPNYYFNNLEIGKGYINKFNYSWTGRVMWEPGHLLSLGIETGYYRLYTFNTPQPNPVHIANTAIPIQIVLSMKFLQNFYVNFAMGQAVLLNKIHTENSGDINASSFSVADFSGTVGYRHRLSSRFSIGTEAKYYYSSGYVDRNIALLFVGGYRF